MESGSPGSVAMSLNQVLPRLTILTNVELTEMTSVTLQRT